MNKYMCIQCVRLMEVLCQACNARGVGVAFCLAFRKRGACLSGLKTQEHYRFQVFVLLLGDASEIFGRIWGSTVVYWLVLPPRSSRVPGLILRTGYYVWACFPHVCVDLLWSPRNMLIGWLALQNFPPRYEWMRVHMCKVPNNRLVSYPGCIPAEDDYIRTNSTLYSGIYSAASVGWDGMLWINSNFSVSSSSHTLA